MKYLLWGFCALLMFGIEPLWGQTVAKYQKSAVLSLKSRFGINTRNNLSFGQTGPALGYRLTNGKGHFHEFELYRRGFPREGFVNFDSLSSDYFGHYKGKITHFTLSYQKNFLISQKLQSKKAKVYFAVGVDYRYFRNKAYQRSFPNKVLPIEETLYSSWNMGFIGRVTPRVTYDLGKRLLLDLNVSVAPLVGIGYRRDLLKESPEKGKSYDVFRTAVLIEPFQIRLGIVRKFF